MFPNSYRRFNYKWRYFSKVIISWFCVSRTINISVTKKTIFFAFNHRNNLFAVFKREKSKIDISIATSNLETFQEQIKT